MKPKHQRLALISLGFLLLAAATALVLTAFQENLVFFHSPTDLKTKEIAPQRRLRVGGLVEKGSLRKEGDAVVRFTVTDLANSVQVRFRGILPDLFREGQGVVAEGHFKDGVFVATEVLAKHDETYMPAEVADAIKKSGQWKGGTGKGGPGKGDQEKGAK
ncbi:MAG: cytochrome c maturation protein CcmE [Rhodospirillales bacterium]|jgi:cytochrome c-type biogenesis protein CcmE|nr:cytochrome c maturation protein CcmE [Rhodospirillaceae bacterium]MAF50099.1 cytochrome c maturation protein CcmE [Rhodospirillaceae bacterium]MDP6428849.1 cytochrome c maturation protein CcmE [Rhodospirillales bacterium]MDP6643960.1 cytochrome c maturation protein CcmE [Rhodospirillales bacterium]MDP6841087.1 cytochrome c maturation protein CcmE [Rhodospirillales bacterium]|tara:strand:+ start:3973 stop:4452 length:480 start_codon:yes stop_codon:yes gene_type:complete